MLLYADNYMGSTIFYATIQKKLLEMINVKDISADILLKIYLPTFTKVNFFLPEMKIYMTNYISARLFD